MTRYINYLDLQDLFHNYMYKWKVSGELIEPQADDIRKTVEKAMRLLSLEDSTNSSPQLEVGHLIIQLNKGHYDVYVHVGEASPIKET